MSKCKHGIEWNYCFSCKQLNLEEPSDEQKTNTISVGLPKNKKQSTNERNTATH